MLDFANIFMSSIPGNISDEPRLTVKNFVCNGCFYAVKSFVSDNFSAECSLNTDTEIELIYKNTLQQVLF